ncbi:MAG TPA: energy transducer TonB [Bryobacteraceae bacterium]|nr:energy transducer TonB [Bryobacteraceae bacterium]
MLSVARSTALTRSGPRPLPIAVSLAGHACLLGMVVLGPPPDLSARAPSLYEQVIKPNEHKLVWYSFQEKLPEVSPVEKQDAQPPGAEWTRPDQTIVSHPKQADRGSQMIWQPAPQIKPQLIRSPNILAFRLPLIAPPPPGPPQKLFVPPAPPAPRRPLRLPELPDPPKMMAPIERKQMALLAANPAALENRPKPRTFVPPAPPPQGQTVPSALPEAPQLASSLRSKHDPLLAESMAAPLANKPQAKAFVPPPTRGRPAAGPAAALPEAPELAAPGASPKNSTRNALPQGDLAAALPGKPQPRSFVAPPAPGGGGHGANAAPIPTIEPAPGLDAGAIPSSNVNVAVVGLNPVPKLDAPLPDSSRSAKFSAGPVANGGAGGGPAPNTTLSVPGLMVRNETGAGAAASKPISQLFMARAAPTSQASMQAAARAASAARANSASDPPSNEIHLAPPPDPEFNGRDVYSLAVQMPNISSYAGSWLMWFAEHSASEPRGSRSLQPPVPVHKVDPKYYPAEIAEKIEGKVVLTGVIGVNGRVARIHILKGLDPRLDLSAAEALLKWQFEPAERDGFPVEVDVVAEIPFLLAPAVKR